MKTDFDSRIKATPDSELDRFISALKKNVPTLQSQLAAAIRERKKRNKAKVKS